MNHYTYSLLRKIANDPSYGTRPDGTLKRRGWLGPHKAGDKTVTEYSVGVNFDGNEVEIPSITPWTSQEDLNIILEHAKNNRKLPPDIVSRAAGWAKFRLKSGKSPFYNGVEDDEDRDFNARQ